MIFIFSDINLDIGLSRGSFTEFRALLRSPSVKIPLRFPSSITNACFPRGIKDYKTYCDNIKPDAICIDYETDPIQIRKNISIPVQGGMDHKILLSDKENLKKEAKKYLDIFKDHPYIFNLGHGVLPETDPNMMDYLVKMVKDY